MQRCGIQDNVQHLCQLLAAQGMDVAGSKPEVLQSFLQAEITRWAKVVKDNKIKAGE